MITPTEQMLLRDVLNQTLQNNALPDYAEFRVKHEKERKTLDELTKERYLRHLSGTYSLTLRGLRACDTRDAKSVFEQCQETLVILQGLYRKKPNAAWTVEKMLAAWDVVLNPTAIAKYITLLSAWLANDVLVIFGYDNKTGFVFDFRLTEKILDVEPLIWETFESATAEALSPAAPQLFGERLLTGVKLSKLKLRGFKSIRHLEELPLRPLNVLIGANGAGKSNFVSFFRFLRAMAEVPGELQLYTGRAGGANTFLFDQARTTPRLEAELSFTSNQGTYEYRCILSATATDSFIFVDERYRAFSQTPGSWQHGAEIGGKETGLYGAFMNRDQVARTLFWLLREIALYQFHNTSETARIKQTWSVSDNQQLKSDGGNLAPFLLRLKAEQPKVYERITSTIRLLAPFFADFVLEPSSQNLMLRWRERGSDIVFDAHQASDGTLRAMALVALLLQPKNELPALIILDEPELGLHPYAIEVVAGLIKSASLSTQIIVATQSTALLNQFEPEDVIVVDRLNRETTFSRLNPDELTEWLEDYSLSELWEKNVLGGRPSPIWDKSREDAARSEANAPGEPAQ